MIQPATTERSRDTPLLEIGARTLSSDRPAEWLTPGRFALFLAILVLAMFPGQVLGWRCFVFRDFGVFSYPVAHFQRECFWRGELPLWNPYNNCGLPFLAQWNIMALYPPSLFYLVLPLSWSLTVFCLAHLVWGGAGMYVLARRWIGNWLAAAVAGVVFAFNGLALNFLMWPSHVATFSWLPWVLWLAPEAWREGGRKQIWAVLACSMQVLAGGPETILITWLFLLLLFCGDCFALRRQWRRVCIRFFSTGALIALICAAQMLPFLQLLSHSQRTLDFGATGSADWSMPLWGWANFLVPLFKTMPPTQGVYNQPQQFWTSSYYVGIATVLFCALALKRARNPKVLVLAILMALGLVLALGDRGILYTILRRCLPMLGMTRYSVKYVILVVAAAPLLSAFGLRAFLEERQVTGNVEWCCLAGLLALIVTLGAFGWAYPASESIGSVVFTNALVRAGFLIGILAVLWFAAQATGRRQIAAGCFALVLVWLDFVTHMPSQNPSCPPSVYSAEAIKAARDWKPAPALGQSRAMLDPVAEAALRFHQLKNVEENYILSRAALLGDCNLLEDVPLTFGFFSLIPSEINRLNLRSIIETKRDFPALLDFMGVAETTAPDSLSRWVPRPTAMPLVTAGQRAIFADDSNAFEALGRTNLNLRRIVLLPPQAKGLITATQQVEARVLSAKFEDQKVAIQTEAPSPAMVVVSQTYYPAWKALLDGRPIKLWRANYAFQAVQVPAGRHTLELVYQDRAFRIGLALSAIGLALCAALWLRTQKGTGKRLPEL